MTRLFLIMLLVMTSAPAYAEWVQITSSDEYIVYFDPATTRVKGDRVKVWMLFNYKTIQTVSGKSFLSDKRQYESDCLEERLRFLAIATYFGGDGTGELVWSNHDEGKWMPPIPGSVGESLFKIMCLMK